MMTEHHFQSLCVRIADALATDRYNGREIAFLDDMLARLNQHGVKTTFSEREEAWLYRLIPPPQQSKNAPTKCP